MLRLTRPTREEIRTVLAEQQALPFSYPEIGASEREPPGGYVVLHHRVCLGEGASVFARARQAVERWAMFEQGWLALYWPGTPVERGRSVAVGMRVLGMWSLNVSRVVYLVDAEERFGFAYGTLPAHALSGEERFIVEHGAGGRVWYDILSFSRPNELLPRLYPPFVRRLQRRFAAGSLEAMQRAVG
jgi:uncharacterized protein (UPF0548 family)